MILYGCAGLGGLLADAPPLDAVYVGAWRDGFRVDFCVQTLADEIGGYQLVVPGSCGFVSDEDVYVTSGGVDACTLPFRAGGVRHFDAVVNATCS